MQEVCFSRLPFLFSFYKIYKTLYITYSFITKQWTRMTWGTNFALMLEVLMCGWHTNPITFLANISSQFNHHFIRYTCIETSLRRDLAANLSVCLLFVYEYYNFHWLVFIFQHALSLLKERNCIGSFIWMHTMWWIRLMSCGLSF